MGWLISIALFLTWSLFKQDCGYVLIASALFAIAGGFEMIASRIKEHNALLTLNKIKQFEEKA